jgi:Protein of unknown function (DUF3592)
MEIVFLLVGLVFVAFGLLVVVSEARVRRGAAEVRGEVVGFSSGPSASGSASFHTVAQYAGPDGQVRYVEGTVGSSVPLDSPGDAVTVLVHPDDPQSATLKSPLSYVIGVVLALMGLVSCAVFFAVFRVNAFSLASAVVVVGWGAWKARELFGKAPLALQAWREGKNGLSRARTFTEASKEQIRWADAAAVQDAIRTQRRTNRYAIPFLIVAGAGLFLLGAHLHKKTVLFLDTADRAQGVVVEMVSNHSSDSITWSPVVEFEAGGRKQRFKDSMGSNPPSYRTGERVGVLYDPANPRDARIDRGRWNTAIPLLVGGFGALLLVLGSWMMLKRASRG